MLLPSRLPKMLYSPPSATRTRFLSDLLAKGVTQETFIGIFITGEIKTWGQVVGKPEITDEIHVYTRSDSCGAAEVWAKYLGNKKQEDLQGIGVSGDPGLLDAVVKDSLGIGFNNLNYAYDPTSGKPVSGAVTVPIDDNNNGTAEHRGTARDQSRSSRDGGEREIPIPSGATALNLVTNGKPTGLTLAFIQWVLTDGQKYIDEVGYIQLSSDMLAAPWIK